MSSHTTLRRRGPSPVRVRAIGLAVAGLLAVLLFAETASRALQPAIRDMPSYLLDGLTSPAALQQRIP